MILFHPAEIKCGIHFCSATRSSQVCCLLAGDSPARYHTYRVISHLSFLWELEDMSRAGLLWTLLAALLVQSLWPPSTLACACRRHRYDTASATDSCRCCSKPRGIKDTTLDSCPHCSKRLVEPKERKISYNGICLCGHERCYPATPTSEAERLKESSVLVLLYLVPSSPALVPAAYRSCGIVPHSEYRPPKFAQVVFGVWLT